jgi:hypothetical protein
MDGDIWEVSLHGEGPLGEEIVNTYKVSPVTLSAITNPLTITAGVGAQIYSAYLACMTQDYTYRFMKAKRFVTGVATVEGVDFTASGTVGTITADSAPIMVTLLIKLLSATVGKHGRGRSYISLIPAVWASVNGLFDLSQTPPQTLGSKLTTTFTCGVEPFQFGVSSKNNLTFFPYTSYQVAELCGVQRRRRSRLPT